MNTLYTQTLRHQVQQREIESQMSPSLMILFPEGKYSFRLSHCSRLQTFLLQNVLLRGAMKGEMISKEAKKDFVFLLSWFERVQENRSDFDRHWIPKNSSEFPLTPWITSSNFTQKPCNSVSPCVVHKSVLEFVVGGHFPRHHVRRSHSWCREGVSTYYGDERPKLPW